MSISFNQNSNITNFDVNNYDNSIDQSEPEPVVNTGLQPEPQELENRSSIGKSYEQPASAMMDGLLAFASFKNKTAVSAKEASLNSPKTAATNKAATPGETLAKAIGDKGSLSRKSQPANPEAVKALQKLLGKFLPGLPVNGTFDAKTNAALRVFQRRVGLETTGVVDKATLEKLETSQFTVKSDYYASPKYTAEDVKTFSGKNDYDIKDRLVNFVAEGEAGFADAIYGKDSGGLSVGILQWTQNKGRLGDLLQKYKDVANQDALNKARQQATKEGLTGDKLEKRILELADSANEFYKSFGGKDQANKLLATLKGPNKTMALSAQTVDMIKAAGAKPIFKTAQRELARQDVNSYIVDIARKHPYAEKGSLSAQSVATGLIVKNIGPGRFGEIVDATISQLATRPDIKAAVDNRVNQLKEEALAKFKQQNPNADQKAIAAAQAKISREVESQRSRVEKDTVVKLVPEEKFNEALAAIAPKVLYKSPAVYAANQAGVSARINRAIDSIDPDERINIK